MESSTYLTQAAYYRYLLGAYFLWDSLPAMVHKLTPPTTQLSGVVLLPHQVYIEFIVGAGS